MLALLLAAVSARADTPKPAPLNCHGFTGDTDGSWTAGAKGPPLIGADGP
jgi:hypothetical protein